jgi:hypothetical protein
MDIPTSEVGYTSATPGRGGHEVHKGHVVALGKKKEQSKAAFRWICLPELAVHCYQVWQVTKDGTELVKLWMYAQHRTQSWQNTWTRNKNCERGNWKKGFAQRCMRAPTFLFGLSFPCYTSKEQHQEGTDFAWRNPHKEETYFKTSLISIKKKFFEFYLINGE